jgi:hypothetical protein
MKQALVGLLALATLAGAQDEVFEIFGGMEISGRQVVVQAAGPGAGEAAAPATERGKRLAQLLFDRRPSAILKAWSAPPAAEEATSAEAAPAPPAEAPESAAPEAPAAEPPAPEPPPETPAAPAGEAGAAPAPAAEPSAEAQAAAAEQAAKDAAAEQARQEAEAKALTAELERFQRLVTLGDWAAVKVYLAGLDPAEAKAGYAQLVKNLAAGPPRQGGQYANWEEKNFFAPEDVGGLAAAAPDKPDDALFAELGKVLARCLEDGSLVERFVEHMRARLDEEDFPLARAEVARILLEAGHPLEAGAFLPGPDEPLQDQDRAVLNLLARHYVARHAEDGKVEDLERAWAVTQAALAEGEVADAVKEEALKRAVTLAPKLRDELGQAWLDESFTARPERGMEILSVIGTAASTGLYAQARDQAQRLEGLRLQTTAAEALLAAAPELARDWSPTLNLLAANWLHEAAYSYQYDQSTARGPVLQRDMFGNFFYGSWSVGGSTRVQMQGNIPQPITTGEMLDIRPSEAWREHLAPGLQPKLDMVLAQLLLKVSEEDEAFPFIERLAQALPDRAEDLVEEFLRVWSDNHNPNTQNQRTNTYMFMYGFDQRANGIPLTRSKQERNLAELAGWVERIRALPIERVDETLLAKAFTNAHSTAEVFRIENIERVFGSLAELEPKTLAELVQTMRSNLASVWRDPALQEKKGTRRREKDIQAEVLRGYEVAYAVVERALAEHPDEWSLVLARAAVAHDENNYRGELAKSSEFAARRGATFAEFQRAADLYREHVAELAVEDQTTRAYEIWFYAALGACDLEAIDHRQQPAEAQFPLIQAAIDALPGEAAEHHRALLANTIFTRMSSVNPAVKFRYVRAGLGIVGDHERARQARDVFDYYNDLVTEIRLTTSVDGGGGVGHDQPFGLLVSLHHTREIERESGGFGKYLVNQNNQAFAFNYGRPTENYRDKFEETAREALDEHFEVLSVTFNHPDAHSRATEEYGWRETPYAYILMRARGPEVDMVPSLRFDLDFLDTTGYAVLPVESPPLPIDASEAEPEPHALHKLTLAQTLDERHAKDGKLVLEVKASALGLVPGLDQLLALDPPGFDVQSVDDQGVSVSEFDKEGDEVAVLSERTFLVNLQAEPDLSELPETFAFGTARDPTAEVVLQRYVDEDLEKVEPVVPLEARYGKAKGPSLAPWMLGSAVALALGALAFLHLRRRGAATAEEGRYRIPERLSPFTVLGLLHEIREREPLAAADRAELVQRIDELEERYFRNGADTGGYDLRRVAEDWVRRVP